jgi:RHS repeat-associated protein
MTGYMDGAMTNCSGTSYYRARYYDPATGRFINEDPVAFKSGINFYRYVQDNPMNLIDPFGLNTSNPPIPWPWWWDTGPGETVGKVIGIAGRAIGIGVTAVLNLTLFADSTARDEDMLKKRPVPCDKNTNDCDQEWADAYEMCRQLLSRPHPPREMTGGYTDLANCARGLVSEACGGNSVGGKK